MITISRTIRIVLDRVSGGVDTDQCQRKVGWNFLVQYQNPIMCALRSVLRCAALCRAFWLPVTSAFTWLNSMIISNNQLFKLSTQGPCIIQHANRHHKLVRHPQVVSNSRKRINLNSRGCCARLILANNGWKPGFDSCLLILTMPKSTGTAQCHNDTTPPIPLVQLSEKRCNVTQPIERAEH